MKKKDTIKYKRGDTMITLLVFIVVAVTITTSATMIIVNNSLNASKLEQGEMALHIAESGAENALLRLIRDPSYTGAADTLQFTDGTATTVVTSGATTKTVVSTGKVGNFTRKIQVNVGYNNSNGIIAITPPWQEIP